MADSAASLTRSAAAARGSSPSDATSFVLSTEVTEGPFWIPSQAIRADIREDREGVPLTLEVAVIDVEKQQPLADAWVDVWTADGDGHYSGYLAGPGFVGPPPPGGPPPFGGPSPPGAAPGFGGDGEIHTGPPPPGGPPAPFGPPPPGFGGRSRGGRAGRGGAPGGRGSRGRGPPPGMRKPQPTDDSTFLRGVQPTAKDGTCTFSLIFPGWYAGRTTHLHIKVLSPTSRTIALHTGQLFFPEDVVTQVAKRKPYADNLVHRVTNDEDWIFAEAGGRPIEVQWVDGGVALVGRTTLGVKGSATVSVIDPHDEEGHAH